MNECMPPESLLPFDERPNSGKPLLPFCDRVLLLDTPDLIATISNILADCVTANDARAYFSRWSRLVIYNFVLDPKGPITGFHTKVKPAIVDIDAYLARCERLDLSFSVTSC